MVLNDREQLKDILAREQSNWGWIVALGSVGVGGAGVRGRRSMARIRATNSLGLNGLVM